MSIYIIYNVFTHSHLLVIFKHEWQRLPLRQGVLKLSPLLWALLELCFREEAVIEDFGHLLLVDILSDDNKLLPSVSIRFYEVVKDLLHLRLFKELGMLLDRRLEADIGVEPRPSTLDSEDAPRVVPFSHTVMSGCDPRVTLAPHHTLDRLVETLKQPFGVERLPSLVYERGDSKFTGVIMVWPLVRHLFQPPSAVQERLDLEYARVED
eukprot:1348240-Amorphochlora_amoeboformis.AAC.1